MNEAIDIRVDTEELEKPFVGEQKDTFWKIFQPKPNFTIASKHIRANIAMNSEIRQKLDLKVGSCLSVCPTISVEKRF